VKMTQPYPTDSLYWQLYNIDQSMVIRLIPEEISYWIEPSIKRKVIDKVSLTFGDKYILIANSGNILNPIQNSHNLINSKQSQEMATFIDYLLKARTEKQTQGPLERANSWAKKKFEQRRSEPKWLASFRESVKRP
ncbi:MAG TPA: hypothetical protein VK921_03240, partial [Anditalea sp.]|nr:hypothetical protein [Anditalea sp.]